MSEESESLLKKRAHLAALVSFIESSAHAAYKDAIKTEIADVEQRILSIAPIEQKDIATILMAHGELDTLRASLERFEKARVILEDRIDEIAEAELQNATETKQ